MGLRRIPTNRHMLHCYPLYNTKQGALFLALRKNKAPLPPSPRCLFSLICLHLHLPLFPPTFLSTPTLPPGPIPFPSLLSFSSFSLSLTSSQISPPYPPLLIVCWADVVLACVEFFPSLHLSFRDGSVCCQRSYQAPRCQRVE